MRAFDGIENNSMHLRNSLLFLVSFWYIREVLVYTQDLVSFIRHHIVLSIITLVYCSSMEDFPLLVKNLRYRKNYAYSTYKLLMHAEKFPVFCLTCEKIISIQSGGLIVDLN